MAKKKANSFVLTIAGIAAATVIGVVLVPVLYVVLQWVRERIKGAPRPPEPEPLPMPRPAGD